MKRKRLAITGAVAAVLAGAVFAAPALTDSSDPVDPGTVVAGSVEQGSTDIGDPTANYTPPACISIMPNVTSTGTVYSIDTGAKSVTVNASDGTNYEVQVPDAANVQIDGAAAALADLQPGQDVTVDFLRCGDNLDQYIADTVLAGTSSPASS